MLWGYLMIAPFLVYKQKTDYVINNLNNIFFFQQQLRRQHALAKLPLPATYGVVTMW